MRSHWSLKHGSVRAVHKPSEDDAGDVHRAMSLESKPGLFSKDHYNNRISGGGTNGSEGAEISTAKPIYRRRGPWAPRRSGVSGSRRNGN